MSRPVSRISPTPTSSGATPGSRADADRERILASAARLFRRQGFAATTVRQIAESCDLLPGSLHYRYRTKDEILLDMMRLGIEKTIRAGIEATRNVQDPFEKVRVALGAHLRMLVSGDDMVYVLLFEWRSLRGKARQEMIAERDRYERYWDDMLGALAKEGLVRADVDLRLVRLFGLGALNWAATWYSEGGTHSLESIGNSLWDIITRGIARSGRHT